MRSSKPADVGAGVRRDGEALVFDGVLERPAVAALWPQALAVLDGVRRFDLRGVGRVDSAGVALLAELAARAQPVAIDGVPDGWVELCAAYRLDAGLRFAA